VFVKLIFGGEFGGTCCMVPLPHMATYLQLSLQNVTQNMCMGGSMRE